MARGVGSQEGPLCSTETPPPLGSHAGTPRGTQQSRPVRTQPDTYRTPRADGKGSHASTPMHGEDVCLLRVHRQHMCTKYSQGAC